MTDRQVLLLIRDILEETFQKSQELRQYRLASFKEFATLYTRAADRIEKIIKDALK